MSILRIKNHPILGKEAVLGTVIITVNGQQMSAKKGEMIAAVLMANGIRIHRYTTERKEARGVYCGIGQCTDCAMIVNGIPNIRTCTVPVEEGMVIETQY